MNTIKEEQICKALMTWVPIMNLKSGDEATRKIVLAARLICETRPKMTPESIVDAGKAYASGTIGEIRGHGGELNAAWAIKVVMSYLDYNHKLDVYQTRPTEKQIEFKESQYERLVRLDKYLDKLIQYWNTYYRIPQNDPNIWELWDAWKKVGLDPFSKEEKQEIYAEAVDRITRMEETEQGDVKAYPMTDKIREQVIRNQARTICFERMFTSGYIWKVYRKYGEYN